LAAVPEHSNGGKPLRFLKVSVAKWDRQPQFLLCRRKISEWIGQNPQVSIKLLLDSWAVLASYRFAAWTIRQRERC
jgi:hypothetical protein